MNNSRGAKAAQGFRHAVDIHEMVHKTQRTSQLYWPSQRVICKSGEVEQQEGLTLELFDYLDDITYSLELIGVLVGKINLVLVLDYHDEVS